MSVRTDYATTFLELSYWKIPKKRDDEITRYAKTGLGIFGNKYSAGPGLAVFGRHALPADTN